MTELYLIVDPEHCSGRDPRWVAEQALAGGVRLLQLRQKRATDGARYELGLALAELCRRHGVPFFINDRVDLALAVRADGVHLGQDDLPLAVARRLLGPGARLGLSTHSPAQAAAAEGADMIGYGPVFTTRSKQNPEPSVGLDQLAAVCAHSPRDVVAIGGIDVHNAPEVARTGARYAAVISAVCGAAEPRAAAEALRDALSGAVRSRNT